MSEAAEDIASSRVARVKSGEPKTAVYGYADPDAHDMAKLGHAEGSHYIDLCILADSYPTLRARIAELEQYKTLYTHALDCVDQVFQVCNEIPNPILPDFAQLGESKFRAVIKLAKAYKELERDAERWRECERLHETHERWGQRIFSVDIRTDVDADSTFASTIDASIASRKAQQ